MTNNWCPEGWSLVKLGDLGEVNRGRSRHRPRYAEHLYGGPYPFIQTGDIKASGGKITSYQQTYSRAGLVQSRLWPVGTMCITIAANIAETGILTFPACFPDSVVGFIANDSKCSVYFIEYMFRYLRRRIQHEATGSVQDNINLATLDRLRFPLPSLREQQAIAHILSTLDDKIALNQQMNRNLEAIAQAIFKSWFVDFDPVRAKMEGRQPFAMDAATAALFPDSFEDSQIGEIPKGWRVEKISRLANISREGLSLGSHPDETFDHYSIPAFDEGQLPKVELGIQIKSNKFIVHKNAVLLSKLNPYIPRVWLPAISKTCRSVCSTEFLVTLPVWRISREYLYALFSSQSFFNLFATLVTGTSGSHQRVKPDYLLGIDVVVPSQVIIDHFTKLVEPLYEQSQRNLFESRTLAAIRDTLLPKLMSGEIRVKQAEKILEDTDTGQAGCLSHKYH